MLNMKMVLYDGREIYPVYLSEEERKKLKEHIGSNRECMWCACKEDEKLFYRLSEDLRFYPEHQGYEHSRNCTRFDLNNYRKRTGYILNEEKGTATAFLKFNPLTFTIPRQTEKEDNLEGSEPNKKSNTPEEPVNESEVTKEKKAEKDPFLSLPGFVRHINLDTYNERVITGGKILSHEYFTSTLFSRMKHVYIYGLRKPLRSLTLKDDNVQFFYAPYKGSFSKEYGNRTSCYIKLANYEKKEFNHFIYERTLKKAEEEFVKMYGVEPDSYNVMAAGFQYNMMSRGKQSTYRVIGRLHLFLISDHGLYCRSLPEQQAYNIILNYIRLKGKGRISFIISNEEDNVAGVFEIKGSHTKGVIRLNPQEDDENIKKEVFLNCNILKDTIEIKQLESFIQNILLNNK